MYRSVRYEGIYGGVDLRIYMRRGGIIEYDWEIERGANIEDIEIETKGGEKNYIDKDGNLIIEKGDTKIISKRPESYQLEENRKIEISSRYKRVSKNLYRYEVSKYDKNKKLTIDPVIEWSTYLGGDEWEYGNYVAVDSEGNIYIIGETKSSDFPTKNAFDDTFNGGNSDAFLVKFSKEGELLWSTFLGGSEWEHGNGLVVDKECNVYVTGTTASPDFPTKNAFDAKYNGGDIFITKFSKEGELLWSTYLGGNDYDKGNDITADKEGNVYVTGTTWSSNFPTKNAFDNTLNGRYYDSFITKFSKEGELLWSTYLGGNDSDSGNAIAVDNAGNVYVTGTTWSSDFPTKNAFDNTFNGVEDVFISKFSNKGKLLWSTYLGGNRNDVGNSIISDKNGNIYITGYTYSNDFPVKNGFDDTIGNRSDIFISKLSNKGELLWSTYLGGNGYESGNGLALDYKNNIYVTGFTGSEDFPTNGGFDDTLNGNDDAFISKFSNKGKLLWSTFFGGSGVDQGVSLSTDSRDNLYIVGYTGSNDIPLKNAFYDTINGTIDIFMLKVSSISLSISLYFKTWEENGLFSGIVYVDINITIEEMYSYKKENGKLYRNVDKIEIYRNNEKVGELQYEEGKNKYEYRYENVQYGDEFYFVVKDTEGDITYTSDKKTVEKN